MFRLRSKKKKVCSTYKLLNTTARARYRFYFEGFAELADVSLKYGCLHFCGLNGYHCNKETQEESNCALHYWNIILGLILLKNKGVKWRLCGVNVWQTYSQYVYTFVSSCVQYCQDPRTEADCISNIKEFLRGCSSLKVEVSSLNASFGSFMSKRVRFWFRSMFRRILITHFLLWSALHVDICCPHMSMWMKVGGLSHMLSFTHINQTVKYIWFPCWWLISCLKTPPEGFYWPDL